MLINNCSYAHADFFVMDLRTERTKKQMVSPAQMTVIPTIAIILNWRKQKNKSGVNKKDIKAIIHQTTRQIHGLLKKPYDFLTMTLFHVSK